MGKDYKTGLDVNEERRLSLEELDAHTRVLL